MAVPPACDSIEKEPECEDFVINIPPDLPPAEWPECCIYRIPKKLYNVNEEAYIPKILSIGPFHHHRQDLRNMETQKLRYLKDFLEYRTSKSQEDLLKIIKDNEVKVRHCYSETFDQYSSKEFVTMILLDAIFILELFLKNVTNKNEQNDYILSKKWLDTGIFCDLILLENQLPFFILEKLYMFAFDDSSTCNHREEGKQIEEHEEDLKKHDAPLITISRYYFKDCDQQKKCFIGKEVKHFTDLVRYLLCSVVQPHLKATKCLNNLYSATKLDMAGLKFKPVEKKCLLDITFTGKKCFKYFPCFNLSWLLACLPFVKSFPCLERMQCILKVPPFRIYDSTEAIFRNLMALEQCHYPPSEAYICNYVRILDYLIDTEKDVDLLVEKKVIVNKIGSNADVAALINKLNLQIMEVESCYYDLAEDLNKHYEYPLNLILATLTKVYFPDIWRGTGTVVGLIVLGFTFWGFLRPYVK